MYRKILTILLVMVMVVFVGCNKDGKTESDLNPTATNSVEKAPEPVYYINHLTGEKNLSSEEKSQNRPVAIMINNASNAQRVQTGLTEADIVYETEVEGGITRLLAVYQDISSVEKIGTVRSARYAYIDLAMGHNAVYVHHGQDPNYAASHLKDTQTITVDTKVLGKRIKNGESTEHTLYAFGDKIWERVVEKGYNKKSANTADWQLFADAETKVTYENVANIVNVPFSSSYKSVFKYDTAKEKYVRYFKTTERKDYFTDESEYFKNIFVLITNISDYPDGKHRKIDLTSGNGYYCVNGTYIPIKWSKGNSSSSFVFTNTDGTPLTVNQGNSYVCIMGKNFAPSFE